MSSSFCCCSPCRPTFKRHVDAIYPSDPNEGLVKNKMETLIYYAVTSPEKLDRIGEYLEQRITRDVYRSNRRGYVFISMEAMDQLLKSCHMNIINLFVESFLKSVQRLLETTDGEFQILASQSFRKYADIEEDAPVYHRSYNFFIDRFSQMCHSDHSDTVMRQELRLAGLIGLNGVIKKTVNEDLAENIWDSRHMDKIVPSLLFNIDPAHFKKEKSGDRETPDLGATLGGDEDICPTQMADEILRVLTQKASFSSIKNILRPALAFLHGHNLWDEPGLVHASHTFEAIMYSVNVDLSYIVIDKLMASLNAPKVGVKQKASIAIVLSQIIGIGVGDSTVGPAVLDIINELLKHLKKSAEKEKTYDQSFLDPMQQLQHALLDSLGEYASKMPDFQKIEIMTFILGKVPYDHANADHELQLILMKALNCVAQKHTPTMFSTTFSPQLLATLLRLLQAPDQDVRLLVLQTFQTLVDRHNNRDKLIEPVIEPGNLALEGFPNTKFNRSDQMFVQKSLFNIFDRFKRVLEEQSNSVEFIEAIYTTCALLYIETSATDESSLYLLDFIDSVQNIAIKNVNLSTENRFALHAIAICFFALMCTSIATAELDAILDAVVVSRELKAPHILPPISEQYHPGLDPNTPEEDTLIDQAVVKEALKNAGKDVQRMEALPGGRKEPSSGVRTSWPGGAYADGAPFHSTSSANSSRRPSTISDGSNAVDFGSVCSSPGLVTRKFVITQVVNSSTNLPTSQVEDISVAAFKKVLEGPTQAEKDAEAARKKELQEKFLTAPLDEIVKLTARKEPELKDFIKDFFETSKFGCAMEEIQAESEARKPQDPYNSMFPELFLY